MKKKSKLSQFERDRIEALLDAKTEQKEIAKILNRDKSTISREISRNSLVGTGCYIAKKA
jgi:IS30 family transposase